MMCRPARALVFAISLFVLPALAADIPGAPKDQYDPFDRTSTIIRDRQTGLEWERGVGRALPWSVATAYCARAGVFPQPGGVGRVPSVKELLTLVDEVPHEEYDGRIVSKMLDRDAFFGAPVDAPYWTSTPGDASDVWVVDFATGLTRKVPATSSAHVRCAR